MNLAAVFAFWRVTQQSVTGKEATRIESLNLTP